jgi:hypothetical protein
MIPFQIGCGVVAHLLVLRRQTALLHDSASVLSTRLGLGATFYNRVVSWYACHGTQSEGVVAVVVVLLCCWFAVVPGPGFFDEFLVWLMWCVAAVPASNYLS